MLKLPKKCMYSPTFIPIDLILCNKLASMNRKRTCFFDFWYFAYLGHFGSGNEPKNAIFQIWPKIWPKHDQKWPKQAKYQKSKKQVLFLFIEANLLQKMGSIGINGGEYIHFLGNFNIRFSWSFQYFLIQLMLTSLKGVGGGSRSKFFFSVILIANLVYFHPLFTEF